jgi:hypothetical protein
VNATALPRGPELIAAHPRPNENAWLLAYAYREMLELVGARGFDPAVPHSGSWLRPERKPGERMALAQAAILGLRRPAWEFHLAAPFQHSDS